jgi:hypothetical protein
MLDENYNVIKCTLEEWSAFFRTKRRFLFKNTNGKYEVSTVFLGTDYGYFNEGENNDPVVFETMVFITNADSADLDMWRYTSYKDALKGHIKLCNKYGIYYTKLSKERTINTIKDLYNY